MARIKSCYISSPTGTDLTYLRTALEKRSIRVVVPDQLYLAADWSDWISRKISDVDLVIGVLTSERQSQWVLFELGQAAALGRQIVLIAPRKLANVPSHLERFLVIRAGIKNSDAINFALDQILASPNRSKAAPSAVPPARPPLGPDAVSIRANLLAAMELKDYRGIERIVVEALRGSGADIVSEATGPDFGADIAVWSDALQASMGNPLLVEVKSRIRGAEELHRTANSLFQAVKSRGTTWGLLLYGEGPANFALGPKGLPPTILACSIIDLINRLQTSSFAEVMLDLRNRRVHGAER